MGRDNNFILSFDMDLHRKDKINLRNLFFNAMERSERRPNYWECVTLTHYSKSQIFDQKFNFDKIPTFSRVFTNFFFLTIFLAKSKLSTAKKSKTTTFSRDFHPNKLTIFSGNQS